ncbi:MAG: hypothetical protein OXH52_18160 [Gammaproteobacteria bacterium]|nr:hypothetical protein [Gammaproteobacteria bacterium]
MEPSVIDTLRYADRLKAAGVETKQAEAMSRALNDELAGGVATKQDLDRAVDELRGEIAKVDAKFDALDAKVDALDAKFDALSGSFETQGKYVFLVLALIAALGLYNVVAPHLAATAPQTDAESAESVHA